MTSLKGSETALLLVHLQADLISSGTVFGSLFHAEAERRDVLRHANHAMNTVRQAGGLVVPLRVAFAPDYSDLNPSLPLLQGVAEAGCLQDGTDGAALVPELKIEASDAVVTHRRPGPFTDSGLQGILASHGIKNVLVGGVATNGSVEGAVRQAGDLGYGVDVLPEACSAADEGTHQASLASMQMFAGSRTLQDLELALTAT